LRQLKKVDVFSVLVLLQMSMNVQMDLTTVLQILETAPTHWGTSPVPVYQAIQAMEPFA